MNFSNIISKKNRITSLLKAQKLHDSFIEIKELATSAESWELQDEITRLETSYKYMIQFFVAGSDDPQRARIYNEIIDSLYTLTDKIIYTLSRGESSEQYYIAKRMLPKHACTLDSTYNNYKRAKAQYDLYTEVPASETNRTEMVNMAKTVEDAEKALFDYVWTTFPISTSDVKLINEIIREESTPSHLRILLISAIYLSLNKFYQEQLVLLLLSLYSCSDHSAKMASLCCAMIIINKYTDRAKSSSSVKDAISSLCEDCLFVKDARSIFFILTRSRDTEKLNKRVQDELLPEIMKISPSVIKKFKADAKSINDLSDFDGNPEWQNILEDSGLSKKIEELNEIQMEGGDVFMGTFAKLKSFPFFSRISNWFMPFYDKNSIVIEVFSEKDALLKDIIANARFLCNSDKYSFCLSLQSVPAAQREMMLSQFDAQNSAIQELKKAELPDLSKNHESIANKFIQDLFRFAKLYNHKNEFYDPFNAPFDFMSIDIFKSILCDKDSLALLGEYFLKNEHYDEAINCFNLIIENFDDYAPTIAQKIGFCHQCMKRYNNALESYLKYDLFNPDDIWNLRHIAICYKALHNLPKAIEYYRKAEAINPDNSAISLNIGHCLLETGDIENALKSYFKVDYLDTKKHKAIRPIAWCTFILGNYKQSHEYYKKVLDDSPTAQDFLNMGHLEMCEHNYNAAISFYIKAIKSSDFAEFSQNINNDKHILNEKGISQLDLCLILDKLRYEIGEQDSSNG